MQSLPNRLDSIRMKTPRAKAMPNRIAFLLGCACLVVRAASVAPSTVLLFCSILDFAYREETRMAMLSVAKLNGLLCKGVMQFASQYRPTRQTVREGFEPSVAF